MPGAAAAPRVAGDGPLADEMSNTGRPAGADGIDVVVGADGGGGTAGPRPMRRLEGRIGRSGSQPVRPSVGTRREGVGLGGRHAGGDRRTRFAQDYNCATC